MSSTSGEEPAASEAVRAEVLTVTSPVRAKMPEPQLTESITDLDGARAGKVEVEWRALERLGLALDLGVGRVLDGATSPAISVRPAANWVLTHSPPLDFHLMAEVSARISHDATENVQDPGEGAPPFSGGSDSASAIVGSPCARFLARAPVSASDRSDRNRSRPSPLRRDESERDRRSRDGLRACPDHRMGIWGQRQQRVLPSRSRGWCEPGTKGKVP